MATPQTGIFALGTASHAYLEMDLLPGTEASTALSTSRRCGSHERRSAVSMSSSASGPSSGPRSYRTARPASLEGSIDPSSASAVTSCRRRNTTSSSGCRGAATTSCSTCRGRSGRRSSPLAGLAHEMVGWPYHHDLDLTGFIDGSENPSLVEATGVVTIPDGAPGEGGSVLLLQQWEHDAIGWESLPVTAQEAIIGRRKADSAELDPRPHDLACRTDRPGRLRGRSSDGTSRTARCSGTGRSSSASAANSGLSLRCSTA